VGAIRIDEVSRREAQLESSYRAHIQKTKQDSTIILTDEEVRICRIHFELQILHSTPLATETREYWHC
jgi:hypothetical protein